MKSKIFAIAVLIAVLLSVLGAAAVSSAAASAEFSVYTDKISYDYGEPITITFRAVNTGADKLTLAFSSSCQADYIIDDLAKEEVVCQHALTEVSIKSGETREWTFTYIQGEGANPILTPGEHNIRAVLIGYPTSEASRSITVGFADSGEGQYCGGVAEIQCPAGLTCESVEAYGGYCRDPNKPAPPKGELASHAELSKFNDVSPTHWASVYINFLADKGLIQGYDDGTFRPDSYITRAELTKISLTGAGIEPDSSIQGSFTDLDGWQKQWVFTAQSLNIVQGYSSQKFDPNRPITRAEALKIMLLAFGVQQADIDAAIADAKLPFPDVSAEDWFNGYVSYAYKNGILAGYPDKTFRPGNLISRAEAAKIIANLWQKNNS